MRLRLIYILVLFALYGAFSLFGVTTPKHDRADNVAVFAAGDADLAAARRQARAHFGDFNRLVEANPGSLALLKIAVPHEHGTEHMWLQLQTTSAGEVSGRFSNNGVEVAYKAGDRYTAPLDAVSDWMVMLPPRESGPIHGGYSTRAILKREPGSVPQDVVSRFQPLP